MRKMVPPAGGWMSCDSGPRSTLSVSFALVAPNCSNQACGTSPSSTIVDRSPTCPVSSHGALVRPTFTAES